MALYRDTLTRALDGAREQFEMQFLASRGCQQLDFWIKTLGELMYSIRETAERIASQEVTSEAVGEIVAKVGTLAALSDFCMDHFGEEMRRGRGG